MKNEIDKTVEGILETTKLKGSYLVTLSSDVVLDLYDEVSGLRKDVLDFAEVLAQTHYSNCGVSADECSTCLMLERYGR